MSLSGRNADVKITSQVATTAVASPMSAVGASTLLYQVTALTHRHWERNPGTTARPKVYIAASTATVPAYEVNHVQGRVLFATTPPAGAITVDEEYLTASSVIEGRSWALAASNDLIETPIFGSGGWRTFAPNLSGATVQIADYWTNSTDSEFFDNAVLSNDMIVELYPIDGTTEDRWEGYALINAVNVENPSDGVLGETVNLTIDGSLYWTTST